SSLMSLSRLTAVAEKSRRQLHPRDHTAARRAPAPGYRSPGTSNASRPSLGDAAEHPWSPPPSHRGGGCPGALRAGTDPFLNLSPLVSSTTSTPKRVILRSDAALKIAFASAGAP